MKSNDHHPRVRTRLASAFTLVEMLVVITIITVMLTVGAMGLKNLSKANGVSAALPVAESVFSEARTLALAKGTKTRVLIHAQQDQTNKYHRERFLRYMIVQYLDDKNTSDPADDEWVLASKGVSLPKGVYFMKDLSEKNAPTLPSLDAVRLPGGPSATAKCYFYEFNAEGRIVDPEPSGNSVPRFVVQVAKIRPGNPTPIVPGEEKNMGGFVIWSSGRTSLFKHPSQILGN